VATAANPYELPINPGRQASPGWWVMVLVIATEAMLFAYLLFSYYYLASMSRGAFPPDGVPRLGLAAPNTVILLASSGTMSWAERGIGAGDERRLRLGMLLTLVRRIPEAHARLKTLEHFSFRYGKVTARLKVDWVRVWSKGVSAR